jgi:hypothetical protein
VHGAANAAWQSDSIVGKTSIGKGVSSSSGILVYPHAREDGTRDQQKEEEAGEWRKARAMNDFYAPRDWFLIWHGSLDPGGDPPKLLFGTTSSLQLLE